MHFLTRSYGPVSFLTPPSNIPTHQQSRQLSPNEHPKKAGPWILPEACSGMVSPEPGPLRRRVATVQTFRCAQGRRPVCFNAAELANRRAVAVRAASGPGRVSRHRRCVVPRGRLNRRVVISRCRLPNHRRRCRGRSRYRLNRLLLRRVVIAAIAGRGNRCCLAVSRRSRAVARRAGRRRGLGIRVGVSRAAVARRAGRRRRRLPSTKNPTGRAQHDQHCDRVHVAILMMSVQSVGHRGERTNELADSLTRERHDRDTRVPTRNPPHSSLFLPSIRLSTLGINRQPAWPTTTHDPSFHPNHSHWRQPHRKQAPQHQRLQSRNRVF